jgi:hypothetical protein
MSGAARSVGWAEATLLAATEKARAAKRLTCVGRSIGGSRRLCAADLAAGRRECLDERLPEVLARIWGANEAAGVCAALKAVGSAA